MEYQVIFICMGNICRSPTAQGVFRHKLRDAHLGHLVRVDSAGTHDYHPGKPPDKRAQAHARQRGYKLADLRARVLKKRDIEQFDLLLVMDDDNLEQVRRQCTAPQLPKLRLLTEFGRYYRAPVVPDPFYGGEDDFERVLDLVEDACDGLMEHVRGELHRRGQL